MPAELPPTLAIDAKARPVVYELDSDMTIATLIRTPRLVARCMLALNVPPLSVADLGGGLTTGGASVEVAE